MYCKACKAKPTIDERCPAHVLQSKEIKHQTTMKCNLDNGQISEVENFAEDNGTDGDMVRNISPQDVGENTGEEL